MTRFQNFDYSSKSSIRELNRKRGLPVNCIQKVFIKKVSRPWIYVCVFKNKPSKSYRPEDLLLFS